MRMNLFLVLAAVALAGCDCAGEEKKPEATIDRAPAVAAQAAQREEKPEEKPEEEREPTEAELRVRKVRTALRDQGLDPQIDETLPTRLGNREECRPIERRRYNLPGEFVYVIVGTYPDEQAAEACIRSYAAFLGGLWKQYDKDFYRLGRYVIELEPKMDPDVKDRARLAVRSALAD